MQVKIKSILAAKTRNWGSKQKKADHTNIYCGETKMSDHVGVGGSERSHNIWIRRCGWSAAVHTRLLSQYTR